MVHEEEPRTSASNSPRTALSSFARISEFGLNEKLVGLQSTLFSTGRHQQVRTNAVHFFIGTIFLLRPPPAG